MRCTSRDRSESPVDPYALSLSVVGLNINEHQGHSLASFDELYVNFSGIDWKAWSPY
ncbi:MAG: hypothetical protein ICV76_02155 [Nitrospiraceae bacterium]|nr:hypothetical protein [Nitrospiraceae bacterium]